MKAKEQLLKQISKKDQERHQYLSELFKFLPDIMIDEFLYCEVKKGGNIILGGEPAKYVYIVLDGDVKGMDYYQTGSVYSFIDLTKMYIIGDFELFSDIPEYMISIYADRDCKLLKIPANRYMKWIKHDENALYMRLSKVLKVLTMERMLDRKYLHMGCRERVINYLILYYEKHRNSSTENITVSLTQTELAEKVGFNIRSVQRVVSALEDENLVTIIKRKMVLSQEQYKKLVDERA